MPHIDLRQLILALTCASVLLTLTISMYSSMQVQKDLLIRKTLESNRVYAIKLARTTDAYLKTLQQRLYYASDEIAASLPQPQPAELKVLLHRLLKDSDSFNSVIIVDAHGTVLAVEPDGLLQAGTQLHTDGAMANLAARTPIISKPFIGTSGRLMVTLTQPLFDSDKVYRGFISGTIYLQATNILHTFLGDHDYRDGSYLYVVDGDGRLIYHQDRPRIGEFVKGNAAIDAVKGGETGSLRLFNSRGIEVLAGFAPIESAHWGVVAQQPVDAALAELQQLTWYSLYHTLPWLLLSLLLIWFLSRTISRPLSQLARRARYMDDPDTKEALEKVRSWYFEAAQLKLSLLAGLQEVNRKMRRLSQESHTDQLTGLANRREMGHVLSAWQAQGITFAVIALDVDFFKRVNDEHGHDIGDQVLQALAALMRENSRPDDLLCRMGGEEFAVFLPRATIAIACEVAERLRKAVEKQIFATGSHLTISCGVAHMPDTAADLGMTLKAVDIALYKAKSQGRNQVVVAAPLGSRD